MGWYYRNGGTRRDLIEERTKGWERNGVVSECLAHCCRGNVLWAVWEQQHPLWTSRFISCDLMEYRGGWGYKPMEEAMHPYYYTCPISYLRMVPFVASAEWRELVREHHARKVLA